VEAVGGDRSHGAARSALSPSQRQENVWPSAKPKRARVKVARKRARPVNPSNPAVETVGVDVIEEPVPGVNTVTEFEETEVREPSKGPKEAEENGSPQGDKSQ